eukprot:g4744.t1
MFKKNGSIVPTGPHILVVQISSASQAKKLSSFVLQADEDKGGKEGGKQGKFFGGIRQEEAGEVPLHDVSDKSRTALEELYEPFNRD